MSKDEIIPFGGATEVLGRRLGKVSGRRRMDLILEKENAAALVRALPAEDLFFLISDIGLDDATQLVAMASREQFRGFVDLDCWLPTEGGRDLSARHVLRWLAAAREGGAESMAERRSALDLEVIELVLREGLRIVDKEAVDEYGWATGAPDEDPDAEWKETPCGSWLVSFGIDEQEGVELRRMLDELYGEDPFGASRFLSMVRHELVSELTEHAVRFRDGRLEDIGFPPPEIAASLYAKADPSAMPPPQPEPVDKIPGFFLAEFTGESFLDQCAAGVVGVQKRTALDRSLMYLANTAMAADRVEPGDTDAVREAMSRMRAYLNLGLYRLSSGDVEGGTELLTSASLRHIFQVGFTSTLERQWRARRLDDELPRADGAAEAVSPRDLFDPPEGQIIAALLARRPLFAACLDAALAAGWPDQAALEAAEGAPEIRLPAGVRPFAVDDDLRAVDEALSRAEGMLAVSKAAGLLEIPDPQNDRDGAHPSLSRLLLTAMFNLAAGRSFSVRALETEDLASALKAVRGPDGSFDPNLESSVLARLTAADPDHPAAAQALISIARERFSAELGGLEDPPDPRFVTALRSVVVQ